MARNPPEERAPPGQGPEEVQWVALGCGVTLRGLLAFSGPTYEQRRDWFPLLPTNSWAEY